MQNSGRRVGKTNQQHPHSPTGSKAEYSVRALVTSDISLRLEASNTPEAERIVLPLDEDTPSADFSCLIVISNIFNLMENKHFV